MGHTPQTPRTSNRVQAAPHQSATTPRFCARTTPRCHAHGAPGIPGAPCGRPPLRSQARRGRGEPRRRLRLRDRGSRTARGPRGLTSPLLHGWCRCLTVLSAGIGARNRRAHTRGRCGPLPTGRCHRRHRPLGHGGRVLLVVGLPGDGTRHEALVRLLHPGVGRPTIVPAFVVALPARPRGGRAAPRRLVRRRLVHLLGRLAPPLWARARACGGGRGGGFRPPLQAWPRGLAGGQPVVPARQRGGPGLPTPAPQGRRGRGVLGGRRRAPRLPRLAPTRACCLPRALAPRLVPRRMARECGPLGRHLAPLHPTRRAREPQDRHAHVAHGRPRPLAPLTERTKIRPTRAHDRAARQGARTRLGARAARTPPPAVGLPPPAHPPRRGNRGRPTGCLLRGGLATAHVHIRHGIEPEKPQVGLRPLRRRTLDRVPGVCGVPGPRRLPTGLAPHRAPRVGLTTAALPERRYDHLSCDQRQLSATHLRLSRTAS
jgi:hypothetical protein